MDLQTHGLGLCPKSLVGTWRTRSHLSPYLRFFQKPDALFPEFRKYFLFPPPRSIFLSVQTERRGDVRVGAFTFVPSASSSITQCDNGSLRLPKKSCLKHEEVDGAEVFDSWTCHGPEPQPVIQPSISLGTYRAEGETSCRYPSSPFGVRLVQQPALVVRRQTCATRAWFLFCLTAISAYNRP
jgi:hypothetical protein